MAMKHTHKCSNIRLERAGEAVHLVVNTDAGAVFDFGIVDAQFRIEQVGDVAVVVASGCQAACSYHLPTKGGNINAEV